MMMMTKVRWTVSQGTRNQRRGRTKVAEYDGTGTDWAGRSRGGEGVTYLLTFSMHVHGYRRYRGGSFLSIIFSTTAKATKAARRLCGHVGRSVGRSVGGETGEIFLPSFSAVVRAEQRRLLSFFRIDAGNFPTVNGPTCGVRS